jgi:hypothetical protein
MGSNFEIGGKRQLGVEAVSFFAAKQKSYIRGVGANVQFAGYPGPLPHRLAFGQTREAVTKLLGKPTSTSGSCDYWSPTPNSRLSCDFARGKLVTLDIGMLE